MSAESDVDGLAKIVILAIAAYADLAAGAVASALASGQWLFNGRTAWIGAVSAFREWRTPWMAWHRAVGSTVQYWSFETLFGLFFLVGALWVGQRTSQGKSKKKAAATKPKQPSAARQRPSEVAR